MSLPVSKQQLNRLGERLTVNDPPTQGDLDLLNDVIRAYQEVLLFVEQELQDIGLTATSRVKTKDVLIDKLRREKNMALARVQDLAGARIVIDGGLNEQNQVVKKLVQHFDSLLSKPSRVADRRQNPSYGYRAVHVIIFPNAIPVEIQVRTKLQNYWAQTVERLADRWGRGIRYGEPPEDAQRPAEGVIGTTGQPVTRSTIIDDLRTTISKSIIGVEVVESQIPEYGSLPRWGSLEEAVQQLLPEATGDLRIDAARFYPLLRNMIKPILTKSISDRRLAGRLVRRAIPRRPEPSVEWVRARLSLCDRLVLEITKMLDDRIRAAHDGLCERLKTLGDYVEQGVIR